MSTAKQTFSCSSHVASSLETLLSQTPVYILSELYHCRYLHERSAYLSSETNVPVNDYLSLKTIQINPWSGSRTAKKPTCVSYRYAWSVGGEIYMKKNPHVINTSWPSWDVISMDVRRVLICQQ